MLSHRRISVRKPAVATQIVTWTEENTSSDDDIAMRNKKGRRRNAITFHDWHNLEGEERQLLHARTCNLVPNRWLGRAGRLRVAVGQKGW
jgi:hypothetical protein